MDLSRNCKHCSLKLTTENAAKKNAKYYRNECRKCRSTAVTKNMMGNPKRHAYMSEYARRKGIVKEYPCETCEIACYKKYKRAFCSDVCRFMAYVNKTETCWLWTGYKHTKGYGKLSFKGNKTAVASRVAYELFNGPIPEGMLVCHTCDIPSCVKPDHLWLGTNAHNMMDMTQKGRQYSILTPKQVLKIRRLFREGVKNSRLMELFNITSSQVSNIIARRIWKHV